MKTEEVPFAPTFVRTIFVAFMPAPITIQPGLGAMSPLQSYVPAARLILVSFGKEFMRAVNPSPLPLRGADALDPFPKGPVAATQTSAAQRGGMHMVSQTQMVKSCFFMRTKAY